MSQNYDRACTVTIDGLGTYVCHPDSCRVRFSIKAATTNVPNTATIRLTNINRSKAEAFAKDPGSEGKGVTISAGYQDNAGVIFTGHVVRPIYGRENPTDTLMQILCADGNQAHTHATVNKTLPPGSTPQDIVDTAIKSMSQYAVKLGFVGPNVQLSQPKYPRSITLVGMARKFLDDVARSKGATWNYSNGQVQILKPSDSMPGGSYVLNSATGLIGMPTLTPDGVYVRTLINPQFAPNMQVHIDQSLIQGYLPAVSPAGTVAPNYLGQGENLASIAADGIYRIVKIDTEADTRGEPWYMDMLVIKPGEHTAVTNDYDNGTQGYSGTN